MNWNFHQLKTYDRWASYIRHEWDNFPVIPVFQDIYRLFVMYVPKNVHFLHFNIWHVFCVLPWINMGLWDLKINAFSFKFTFYTASELEMGS